MNHVGYCIRFFANSGDNHKHVVLMGAKNTHLDVKEKLLRFGKFEVSF